MLIAEVGEMVKVERTKVETGTKEEICDTSVPSKTEETNKSTGSEKAGQDHQEEDIFTQNYEGGGEYSSNRRRRSLITPILKPATPKPECQGLLHKHDNSEPSVKAASKRVSIVAPTDEDSDSQNGAKSDDKETIDWSSFFTRAAAKPVDALQQKVQGFLTAQKHFNKLFPKGSPQAIETSSIHRELVDMERAKKACQRQKKMRKSEIVTEVLDRLSICDEDIRFHYRTIME